MDLRQLKSAPASLEKRRQIEPVEVPPLTGYSVDVASAVLGKYGLTIGTVASQPANPPTGEVLSQEPKAGTLVPRGTSVNVWVASPPKLIAVPNLVRMDLAAATTRINEEGLTLGNVTPQPGDTERSGVVSNQFPPEGAQVEPGTSVAVWLGEAAPATVPNLVTMSLDQARATLADARLILGRVSQEQSTVTVGSVLSQSDDAGTSVPPGTAVDVVLSIPVVPVTVPGIAGLTVSEAASELEGERLRLGDVAARTSPRLPGSIVEQSPAAGSSLAPDSVVSVVVAEPDGLPLLLFWLGSGMVLAGPVVAGRAVRRTWLRVSISMTPHPRPGTS